MTANPHRWFSHGWLLPIMVALGAATLCAVIILSIFFAANARQKTRKIAMIAHEQLQNEIAARQRLHNQVLYLSYVLCRSQGRAKEDCRIISHGAVLPASLTLKTLDAEIARLSEARVGKLFVGPNGTPITGKSGAPGLRGAQGSQGPQGPQGKTGAQGPQGKPGTPGGPAGPRGATGAQGERGPAGAQGPQGKQGERGPQGAAGARGEQGAAGARGAQGAAGERGAAGPQGQAGPQGPAGPAGPPGPPGPGTSCPAGYALGAISINTPGGQKSFFGCVKD